MTALILTIILGVFIITLFKVFPLFKINTFAAILVNYLCCILLGWAMETQPIGFHNFKEDWFYLAIILGFIFLINFYMIGKTIDFFGVAVGTVATKMSIAISVIAAFVLFNETVTVFKIVGVLMAIAAVILVSFSKENINIKKALLWYPIIVLINSALVEILLNYANQNYLTIETYNLFNFYSYGTCAVLSVSIAAVLHLNNRFIITFKDVLAGVILSAPNYFCIYFTIKALDIPGWGSAVVYPVISVSIISLATLLAWLFFKEKLLPINFIGLLTAVIAILLITL